MTPEGQEMALTGSKVGKKSVAIKNYTYIILLKNQKANICENRLE